MSRLAAALARATEERRAALSIYIPFGFPNLASNSAYLDAIVAGGADWIEMGLPFSDPAADGPILQAATHQALQAGATVDGAFAAIAALRRRHATLPIIAMTYANLVHRRGFASFARDLATAGGDGLIVPDAPLEEAAAIMVPLRKAGLAHIPLVTPATPDGRMAAVAATASGFLYVVSSLGVTGQGGSDAVAETVRRARPVSPVPLLVGFGVRTPDDVRRMRSAGADGVIVGTEIARQIQAGATPDDIRRFVAQLRAAC